MSDLDVTTTEGGVAAATAAADAAGSGSGVRTVPESEGVDAFKAITSQSDLDAILTKRLERADKASAKKYGETIKSLEDKIAAFETEKLSESEKLLKRLEEAEKSAADRAGELTKLQRERQVFDLAQEHGLPRALWDRVHGDTDEDILADIKSLLDAFPKADPKGPQGFPQGPTPRVVTPTGEPADPGDITADQILKELNYSQFPSY
ncbi:capsid assembly scaffolding protein Gp46 family protein [Mycobacteroides abscessus]|uniref:capsid assembly scaffolding protein Gp46 family protein n=1 Tax=Mycobacteroides abscessus TaxID=36809 RepID=UPI0018965CC9|nr:DUF4355 domain-containing protein [Mycobacteroides abscessus]